MRIHSFFLLLFTVTNLWSDQILPERAIQVACSQLKISDLQKYETGDLRLHSTPSKRELENLKLLEVPELFLGNSQNPAYYVIADISGGFVVVSADDRIKPILAISSNGEIDPKNLPPAFVFWMQTVELQIQRIISSQREASIGVVDEWTQLEAGQRTQDRLSDSVLPLLATRWGQGEYYNTKCPFDSDSDTKTPTGCVATAMAQIMNYWEYPVSGFGTASYHNDHYGLVTADFENSSYDWAQMPDRLSSASSQAQIDAVATLMFHCGAAVEMRYTPTGSGSYGYKALKAFKTHFDYGSTVTLIKRSETTYSLWLASLENELDSGRPVFYRGADPLGGGHAWVCDGYDKDGRFHMNWGWGGLSDGYFQILAGIEVDGGNYYIQQEAIVGIAPQSSTKDGQVLELNSPLTVSPDPAEAWKGFYVNYGVINSGETPFSGTLAVGLFDENNSFLRILDDFRWRGYEPQEQSSEPIQFSTSGKDWIAPGKYYLSAVSRPSRDHNWAKLRDGGFGSYPNRHELVISKSADTSAVLTLDAPLSLGNGDPLRQGTAFDLNFNVKNTSAKDISGGLLVGLNDFNTGKYIAKDLYVNHDLYLGSNQSFADPIRYPFEDGDVPAGEYLVTVFHYKDGDTEWSVTNSGEYTNSVKVKIDVGPDRFEPNDWNDSRDFSRFRPLFTNSNTSKIRPRNTSIHSVDDKDHFYIQLEEGYDYTVDAEVYDSENSTDGYSYTTDVHFFSMASGQEGMRGYYDDVMPLPIKIQNGGYAFFGVDAWGDETGSYQLEITVTRHELGEVDPNDPRNVVTPLYRFYREGNDSHFFTVNESEKEVVEAFWEYEGVSQHVLHSMVPSATPVYRMFNSISKSHFYTASESELKNIQENLGHIYSLEGVAFYALKYPLYNAKPVFRFYSPKTYSHFFTISETEKDQIIQTIPETDLKYDGVAWYAFH